MAKSAIDEQELALLCRLPQRLKDHPELRFWRGLTVRRQPQRVDAQWLDQRRHSHDRPAPLSAGRHY